MLEMTQAEFTVFTRRLGRQRRIVFFTDETLSTCLSVYLGGSGGTCLYNIGLLFALGAS